MDPLIDPGEYAALAYCTYLNQASLGLIPRTSLEASVRFLAEVAQHGNLRLSDQAEAGVLDGLRTAAAELLGAPVPSVAVVGGASEGLGQLAALLSSAGVKVVLVASDFPSVTYPWLAARDRLGMGILLGSRHPGPRSHARAGRCHQRPDNGRVRQPGSVRHGQPGRCRGPGGACPGRWCPGGGRRDPDGRCGSGHDDAMGEWTRWSAAATSGCPRRPALRCSPSPRTWRRPPP